MFSVEESKQPSAQLEFTHTIENVSFQWNFTGKTQKSPQKGSRVKAKFGN